MFYVYVLKMHHSELYFGSTHDLKKRVQEHKSGKVFTTKKHLPIVLVYYECYLSESDAKERERMLKRFGSAYSHLKKRIKYSIKGFQGRG